MSSWELSQGYLEAILDAGGPTVEASRRRGGDEQETEKESVKSTAINYFMQQMAVFDDTDLHRAWRKVATYKQQHQRGSRLENMSWRIWQILRRRKILEMIDAERVAKETIDREEGRKDASEDLPMSEDAASEDGDKESSAAHSTSDGHLDEMWSDDKKSTGVYVVMISMHGLVRGKQMELGRDSDTGGQVKYVVELARALAMLPEVYRVDLVTRQILDPEVDSAYGEPLEPLLQTDEGSLRGAYIVRVPCGPSDKYIRKELLWPHIQEFADGALAHIVTMSQLLGDQIADAKRVWPCVIHGHYADAGNTAALLSGALHVPMVMTGHSLGRNKMEQLLKQGRQSFEEIAATYKIACRVEAEETSLDAADFVITSTKEEVSNQWSHYDGYDMKIAQGIYSRKRKHLHCSGRFVPVMAVIPPGLDLAAVPEQELESEPETPQSGDMSVPSSPRVLASPRADPVIWAEINRFLANPAKPMVLALARPDPKKNLTTLLKAYGEDKQLRELANLTLIMGNRDSIDAMATGNANTMTNVLKLIDKYDLYGQVAYPKHHLQSDVPDIYQLAARTKGVFVNPALVEPFGLTLIEAAAHGLPIVATKNGGPVDIVKTLHNGILVDPHDSKAIAEALGGLVADNQKWAECRRNGLKNINCYRWSEHCKTYLKYIRRCLKDRLPHVDGDVDTGFYEDEVPGALEQSLTRAFRTLEMVESLTEDDFDKILRMVKMEAVARANGNEESEELVRHFSHSPDFYASLTTQEDGHAAPGKVAEGKNFLNGVQVSDREALRSRKSVEDNIRQAGAVIGKRKKLVVIAMDNYMESGEPSPTFSANVRQILEVLSPNAAASGVGFALATALSAQELVKALSPISLRAFDLVITGSGSKLYYPRPGVSNGAGLRGMEGESVWLCPDNVYEDQIGYRWGGNAIKSTMIRLAERDGYVSYDEANSNTKLVAFKVENPEKARLSEDLLAYVRRRGLRANFMYCREGTALHVLPLHASRGKALRYLFVKWGINVANMVVVVGPHGDSDYRKLMRGAQQNIVVGEDSQKSAAASRLLQPHPWLAEGDDTAEVVMTRTEMSQEALRKAFQSAHVL